MAPPGRKLNGEGSISLRSDGRWMGRFYAWTAAGTASASPSTARS